LFKLGDSSSEEFKFRAVQEVQGKSSKKKFKAGAVQGKSSKKKFKAGAVQG
jgi:hypothetical protein